MGVFSKAKAAASSEAGTATKEVAIGKIDEMTGYDTSAEMEKYSQAYGLLSTVFSLPFEPVVGGLKFRAVFFLVALGVIGVGTSTIITKATGEWSQKVTEIEAEYALELPYPDFYLCIPASFVESYKKDTSTNAKYMVISGWPGSQTLSTLKTQCNGTAADMPARVSVERMKLAGQISNKSADSCAYGGVTTSPNISSANIEFGCNASDSKAGSSNCKSPNKTHAMSARVTKLVNAMPSYTDSTGKHEALCVGYPSLGLSQKRADPPYEILLSMETAAVDDNSPFFMGYLMEKDKEPVDAKGKVVATEIMFSGTGGVVAAQLQLEKVKDETKGDTDYVMEWKYGLWTKILSTSQSIGSTTSHITIYSPNFKEAVLGFWYSSFVVQKITIRWKKWDEIYAELGGIWAASVALLAYAFVKSGHIDPRTKKEAYVFKYLPNKMRVNMISASGFAKKEQAPSSKNEATPSV